MYRCNSCGRIFDEPDCSHSMVAYGNEYVSGPAERSCRFCQSGDFEEIRQRDDDDPYLFIEKGKVIDYAVSALAFLNSGKAEEAKECVRELIGEAVSDTAFNYDDSLDNMLTQDEAEELTAQLQEILEVRAV